MAAWGRQFVVSWAEPQEEPDAETMSKVCFAVTVALLASHQLDLSRTDRFCTRIDRFQAVGLLKRCVCAKSVCWISPQHCSTLSVQRGGIFASSLAQVIRSVHTNAHTYGRLFLHPDVRAGSLGLYGPYVRVVWTEHPDIRAVSTLRVKKAFMQSFYHP